MRTPMHKAQVASTGYHSRRLLVSGHVATPEQAEERPACRNVHESSRRASKVCAYAAMMLLVLTVAGDASLAAVDSCRQTTRSAERACRAEGASEYWIAIGKCSNVAGSSQLRACQQQASADQRDAIQTCNDQRDARDTICERLGRSPYDPDIVPGNFVASIDNPFLPLSPGTTFVYEGQTAEGLEHNEVSVTHNTKVILGVTCIEVHDIVRVNGELKEDTLDWFAQDTAGNVWYFGENSKELDGNEIISLEGSWKGGVEGAKPGIVMRAHPAVGDFYRQEFSLATAEDMAEVVELSAAASVPAGSFPSCLKTREFTPLEPDAEELKFYALGVGNVLTIDQTTGDRLELVSVTTNSRRPLL